MTTCTKITFPQDKDVDLGVAVGEVVTNMGADVGVVDHTPTEAYIATPTEIATTLGQIATRRAKIIKPRQHDERQHQKLLLDYELTCGVRYR